MQPATSPNVSRPVLYSPVAVQVFAFVFMPLFGGIMACSSLKSLGQQVAARRLLWECIFFTAILFFMVYFFSYGAVSNRIVSLGLNMAGAFWLGRRYNRLAPEASQPPHKSLNTPLFFALIISLIWAYPMLARWYDRY